MNVEKFDRDKFEKEWATTASPPLPLDGLIFYLKEGREIDFNYQGQSYFINHSRKGRTVWIGRTAVSETYDDNFIENLDKIFLQGKSLTDIFRDEEGLIEFLY